MTTPARGGFLSRWSRRKIDAREGVVSPDDDLPAIEQPSDSGAEHSTVDRPSEASAGAQLSDAGVAPNQDDPPLPTLQDVQALTQDSDFSPFVKGGVTPEVKNAALKKLFSDPHYNVMDRLDIYIDDYSNLEPLPESMLKRMASAHALKMFESLGEDNEVRPDTAISARETSEVGNGEHTEVEHTEAAVEMELDASADSFTVTSPVPQWDSSSSDGSEAASPTPSR